MLRAIQEGKTVGEAVEHAASFTEEDMEGFSTNLQLWFRNWTAEGFFQAVIL